MEQLTVHADAGHQAHRSAIAAAQRAASVKVVPAPLRGNRRPSRPLAAPPAGMDPGCPRGLFRKAPPHLRNRQAWKKGTSESHVAAEDKNRGLTSRINGVIILAVEVVVFRGTGEGAHSLHPDEVGHYAVDVVTEPALWKAQQTFLTAEQLRGCNRLDCAANRYYYACFHAMCHRLKYKKENGGKRSHGEIIHQYVTTCTRLPRNEATEALALSGAARRRADYSSKRVSDGRICDLLSPVTKLVVDAFRIAGLSKVCK